MIDEINIHMIYLEKFIILVFLDPKPRTHLVLDIISGASPVILSLQEIERKLHLPTSQSTNL